MTGRRPRDVRADAISVIERALGDYTAYRTAAARAILVALDGNHIALTDTSRPPTPDADPLQPVTPAAPDSPARDQYRAARAALKGNQQ